MDITHAGLVKIKSWLQEVPSRNNQLQKKPKFMILKIMNFSKKLFKIHKSSKRKTD